MQKEKKLAKAMITLFIDNEQKKLYDRKHDLELSHNRKVKLLKQCLYFLESHTINTGLTINPTNHDYQQQLIGKIKNELENPYLRHNWGYYSKKTSQPVYNKEKTSLPVYNKEIV